MGFRIRILTTGSDYYTKPPPDGACAFRSAPRRDFDTTKLFASHGERISTQAASAQSERKSLGHFFRGRV
jgi:hypothetical protein